MAAEPGAAEAERQIRQHRAASNAAILAHDIEGIVEHWLPDVHVTHSSGDVIGGIINTFENNKPSFVVSFLGKDNSLDGEQMKAYMEPSEQFR